MQTVIKAQEWIQAGANHVHFVSPAGLEYRLPRNAVHVMGDHVVMPERYARERSIRLAMAGVRL